MLLKNKAISNDSFVGSAYLLNITFLITLILDITVKC